MNYALTNHMLTTDCLSINKMNLYLKGEPEPLELRTIIYHEEVEQASILTPDKEKKLISYEEIDILEVFDYENKRLLIKK